MNYDDYVDAPVFDKVGNKVGSVDAFYYTDDETKPVWATVKSGLFGLSKHFIPLDDVTADENGLTLQTVTEDVVKHAPAIEDDDATSDEDDARLRNYYHYETQRENGVDSVDHDTEPMPNVGMSENYQPDKSNADTQESTTTTPRSLHRYVVKDGGGRVWDVKEVTAENSDDA